ncbi:MULTISPECIES: hypothetical protein [Pseudomonas]|uniref:hypothetical protein n=1 Tax=Pseudomonas TaxID=286 RepID=UPI001AE80BBF|nr:MULTISPECIES: hypothetical protein [unclassified Pseudomonas]MBP1125232.1 Holliday junction resolvase RusA-like endonuclease [Pseudomonas sp. PvP025]MDQ0399092.1 Holliday junction resolvase RusA-like endonuclease [Pseudomonas sp. PvP006]
MKSVNTLTFSTLIIIGVVGVSVAQAQTTAGYYRTCANYNPDYQEVYDNSQTLPFAERRSDDLTKYLRDSGCRKQVIRAVDVIRDKSKKCAIPSHPDYDTYQRALIDYLKGDGFQSNDALMNTSIEMVAPEVMKYVLKCS